MSAAPADAVEMQIRALVVDPVSKMPVVILEQPSQNAYLPIWIGVCEANAIALELEGITTPRPMTHDLITTLLAKTGHSVDSIHIHSLRENVFHATIYLSNGGDELREIDSRPSDALAIALRARARILVSENVLADAVVEGTSHEDAVRLILERLRPEDLGEYEM
jgi:bifunctional DNase/RNase